MFEFVEARNSRLVYMQLAGKKFLLTENLLVAIYCCLKDFDIC